VNRVTDTPDLPDAPEQPDLPASAEGSEVAVPQEVGPGGRIEEVRLEREMQRSYLDYAMSVIVGRALPDVRDGLKPVHRRVLYAMYDGGYRPDRGFNKSSRIVGDVMGQYHPHGDTAIYDTLVRMAQPWSLRYPLVDGQGNFGSPGDDGAAAMRYTEAKMASLAMEMVRDIDEETVDFQPNYDGKGSEPVVLPSRFPNLLVNGGSGIAVGMATNIPPHNLVEVADGVRWALANPELSREELLTGLMERISGPDFPTGATIVGRRGIDDAYRTGRGSVIMRAIVEVEDLANRTCLVVTQLPYQVNPDALMRKMADLARDGKVAGISDLRNESSGRAGLRLVVVLKRDAVAQVVLNNLYKHTQLQDSFGCNMLALVDGVPRTLSLDAFVTHWIRHQLEIISRRTAFRLRKAQERAHILRGYLKALDALDDVIALIRASATVDEARTGLMELLEIDEIQATAILDMQLRRLAALERQRIIDEAAELEARIADYQDILASESRQRAIVDEELAEIVAKNGEGRRTKILEAEGEFVDEDLIAEEDIVVTVTRDGYAKRTRTDLYRAQRRGGRGVRGAALRQDDVVEHFFVTTTHHWMLFFTTKGRVYRAKGYSLPDAGRDAKGQHLANLLALDGDEQVAQILAVRDYEQAPYLVLATREGQVKKTKLTEYDTPRTGGIIAINLREGDEVIAARLVSDTDDLLLVSTKGQSARFTADNATLRPMGRSTAGVTGMKFKGDDRLLAMDVVRPDSFVVTVTDGGYAKRTPVDEWSVKGRGIYGVTAMKLVDGRGGLVGATVCDEDDELFAIASNGVVIRTSVEQIRSSGRATMGVKLINLGADAAVVAVARGEAGLDGDSDDEADDVDGVDGVDAGPTDGDTPPTEAPEVTDGPGAGHDGDSSDNPEGE